MTIVSLPPAVMCEWLRTMTCVCASFEDALRRSRKRPRRWPQRVVVPNGRSVWWLRLKLECHDVASRNRSTIAATSDLQELGVLCVFDRWAIQGFMFKVFLWERRRMTLRVFLWNWQDHAGSALVGLFRYQRDEYLPLTDTPHGHDASWTTTIATGKEHPTCSYELYHSSKCSFWCKNSGTHWLSDAAEDRPLQASNLCAQLYTYAHMA